MFKQMEIGGPRSGMKTTKLLCSCNNFYELGKTHADGEEHFRVAVNYSNTDFITHMCHENPSLEIIF